MNSHLTVPFRSRIQIAERIFYFVLPAGVGEPLPSGLTSESSSSDGEIDVFSDELESVVSTQPEPETVEDDVMLYDAAEQHDSDDDDYSQARRYNKKKPKKAATAKSTAPTEKRKYKKSVKADKNGPSRTSTRVPKRKAFDDEQNEMSPPPAPKRIKATFTLSEPKPDQAQQTPAPAEPAAAKPSPLATEVKAEPVTTPVPIQPAPVPAPTPQPKAPPVKAPLVLPKPNNEHVGKPEKPPYDVPSLIAQALTLAGTKKMANPSICEWIAGTYPFYAIPANRSALHVSDSLVLYFSIV